MRVPAISWLLAACGAAAIPLGCVDPGGLAEMALEEGAPSEPRRAVVVLSGEAAELESELRGGWAFRALLPRLPAEEWEMEVETGRGLPSPDEADVAIAAAVLPLPEELQALVRDLPVELGGEEVVFAGTRYSDPSMELALRLPGPEERWLVTGASRRALVRATNRTLARVVQDSYATRSFGEGERPEGHELVDYALESRPWRTRTGRWIGPVEDGRYAVDPEAERDEFAARERWRDALVPVGSGAVRLLVPPSEDGAAELGELAAALARAAATMAPEVSLDAGELRARPVDVALEADHVTQVRHADAVGLAVAGSGGGAPDLHVVLRPEDRWAYRHAVARVLLERSGAADGRPRWLVDGAALWLAAEAGEPGAASWYGRPYRDWLPDLAAAGVLPTADVLLDPVGPEGRGDGSDVLWTPAAAAVVERLPGDTAEEKLALADRAAVERALTAVEHAAAGGSGSDRADHRGGAAAPGAPRESSAPGSPSLPAHFLRGVSFAMSNSVEGGYHAPAIGERLDELAALGADAVSLMPFAYQPRPDAPELRFMNASPGSETDAGLIHAARQAHRRGFTVLWKPHLWLGHGSWPGEVAMTSEADWRRWWRTYRRYVLHHAVLAAYAGAELFAVGVELERTVERRDDWEALIRDVRRVYPGAVTYAANWGQGAERARFWESLDAVGVDAYYSLVEPGSGGVVDPTDAELAQGAAAVAGRLEALARRTGKPVLLTEVGFPARRAAWLEPHREDGELSPEDQARAYRALLGALEGRPWLRGVFVWKVMSGDRVRHGLETPSFRFLGHPAEAAVADYFRRQAASEAAGGL